MLTLSCTLTRSASGDSTELSNLSYGKEEICENREECECETENQVSMIKFQPLSRGPKLIAVDVEAHTSVP